MAIKKGGAFLRAPFLFAIMSGSTATEEKVRKSQRTAPKVRHLKYCAAYKSIEI